MADDRAWSDPTLPGRTDRHGTEWWATDPYPTWYRHEGRQVRVGSPEFCTCGSIGVDPWCEECHPGTDRDVRPMSNHSARDAEFLDAAERLAAAATEGPWGFTADDERGDSGVYDMATGGDLAINVDPYSRGDYVADLSFIAAARDLVPRLVRMVRERDVGQAGSTLPTEDEVRKVLGTHRAVRDERGEAKSCSCGTLLWSIQRQGAPSHEEHQARAVLDLLRGDR